MRSIVLLVVASAGFPARADETGGDVFARENLVAWCVVPFDAKKRTPAERAGMIAGLGLKRVAYDWRAEHVPTFAEEIRQYREHGLEFFAFWDWHPSMAELIREHGIRPQIWKTVPSPAGPSDAERVRAAADELLPLARRAADLGCAFGLYNHGGWGGEPKNLAAVCRELRDRLPSARVGIVYNLHHAHDRFDTFESDLALMKPDLLCLNLNGMNDGAEPKILPLGRGKHDRRLLAIIAESGYRGPVGIIDHRPDADAEQSLKENLEGLAAIRP